MTATASTVMALETVIGISTTKPWICCRSVAARRHELAGLGLVVEGEVQPLEVGEQAAPELGLGPVGDAEGEVAAGAGARGRHQADGEHGERPLGAARPARRR